MSLSKPTRRGGAYMCVSRDFPDWSITHSDDSLHPGRAPLQNYAIIAVFMVATMGLSNTAMLYLNFPTQVLFKSCKLIPVMIGGVLLLKKRYVLLEYISALLLCAGLVEVTIGNAYAFLHILDFSSSSYDWHLIAQIF